MRSIPSIPRPDGIPQNSVIAAALLIGFLVYITIKGRLAAYINLFFTKASASVPTGNAANPPAGVSPLPAIPTLPLVSVPKTNSQGQVVGGTGTYDPSIPFRNWLNSLLPK